jgi:AcrR family transcriptional regulator
MTDAGPHVGEARDTRAEILDVAAELFGDRGYDATSLREIAERLGISKAALYYHFPSKQEILRALVEPMGDVLRVIVERLETAHDIRDWAEVLSWMIGLIVEHIAFFRLLERNRYSMRELYATFAEISDHIELRERVAVAAHAAASDIEDEIRMFAALGAVTGFDDWAPKLLSECPPDIIQRELRAAVDAILRA